ncbi:MAG: AMP-binding protein [Candidatus Polarisedimenticolia bacterium]
MPRRTRPGTQDDRWERQVETWRRSAPPPFDKQREAFRRIYAARLPEDGPPPAWRPGPAAIASSNLGRFMAERGVADYRALHAWTARDREGFWAAVVERLGIVFEKKPERTLDPSAGVEAVRWLPGARLNIADSCFTGDPSRPAIVSGGEGREGLRLTSRGELEALANRVARGLRARAFAPGDPIALYLPMTVECVAAYLGMVRAGLRVVSIADSFSAAELKRRCDIAGARGVVTIESYSRGGRPVEPYARVREAGAPRAIVLPDGPAEEAGRTALRTGDLWWRDLLSGDPTPASRPADADETINILFSSGTTADPKAIPWTHLTPIKCAMDGHFHQDLRPGDRIAWPTSIGWMMGPWLIFASLINGASMALFEGAPGGPEFARFVRDAGVTVLGVVPSLVRAWRNAGAAAGRDWEKVRLFSSTGEPAGREDMLWLMSLTGYRAPVIEYLGGTEIGGGHITGTVVQPASPATFTTPALGIDFVLLQGDGRPCAEGSTGELFLIPPSLGLSQTLLNDDHHRVYYEGCPPGPDGATLRRHGDLFERLHGGFYRAQGRADDTMNLGGIKVSALELERVIDRHPAVHESAAVAVQPDGEGAAALVIFAVPKGAADRAALLKAIRVLLAKELNPLFRVHDLVLIDALPRTASNKLMRRALRAAYRA